jgi:hypothetical protein
MVGIAVMGWEWVCSLTKERHGTDSILGKKSKKKMGASLLSMPAPGESMRHSRPSGVALAQTKPDRIPNPMEAFLSLLIAGGLLIWLISHLIKTGERVERLERDLDALKRQLRESQREEPAQPAAESPTEHRPALQAAKQAAPWPPAVPIVPSSLSDETLSDRREDPVPSEMAATTAAAATPPPLPRPVQAPPPPPTQRRMPPPLPVAPGPDWRALLRRVNLWPPSGETAEAAIGAWWLTRIGLVVMIIAAVFFGVRIAQDVPAWVRVAALACIAAGVTLLGSWLERRLPKFGRLVASGGVALGYFTAFAAYGIEATKIISDPVTGFLVQALAAAVMIVWSLWKRDQPSAAMGMLLGLVACWFSHWHDLDQFTAAGLLTLAAGAGLLLVMRLWRWPYGVALLGSWFGFLVLAVRDWPPPGDTPSLSMILGLLAGLTIILEAANFLAEERARADGTKWRRWLAVINSSLAVGIGWLAVRLAFPRGVEAGELDAFFLVFAILMGVFAALRFWKKHGAGLTEMYFLKAAGLLALFVVECYDGPTRWLSLSVQCAILLWAWRRSALKWIEVGFWVLMAATIVLIWHDLVEPVAGTAWAAVSVRNVVGTVSLALLAAILGLHGHWSLDRKIGDVGAVFVTLRVLAALATGAAALPLVMIPSPAGQHSQAIVVLSFVAIAIGASAIWLRHFSIVLAGLAALIPAFLALLVLDEVWSNHQLWTGLWLAALGLGLAELALHRWNNRWMLGNGTRLILQGGALAVLAATTDRFGENMGDPSLATTSLCAIPFLIAAIWALYRQSAAYPESHLSGNRRTAAVTQWLLAAVVGLGTLVAMENSFNDHDFGPALLTVAAALLFGAAFLTKNHAPALAGGIPLLLAVPLHLVRYHSHSEAISDLLGAAAIILAVCWGTALVLWWRFRDSDRDRAVFTGYDFALHALALVTLHWIFRTHLDMPTLFLADAVTALLAVVIWRFVPLPALAAISMLPLVLAVMNRVLLESLTAPIRGESPLWWLAAAAVFGWIWLGERFFARQPNARFSEGWRGLIAAVHGGVAALVLMAIGRHAAPEPWHAVAIAAFALVLTILGRFEKVATNRWWSLVPLAVAILMSAKYLAAFAPPPPQTLVAICLVAAVVIAHGIIALWRARRENRSIAWIHGLIALALLFPAFEQDRLGVVALTTVCWGIAAVALFVLGFATALRPYRLAGLIGLALAMVRMFLVDIDDSLYRIYAFFAIALVLLGMGYLYHRFRHLIERADRHLSGEGESDDSHQHPPVDAAADPGEE